MSSKIPKLVVDKIKKRTARIGVIGLGYVGLPLAMEFARCALLAILGTYTYALARPRLGASVASAIQVSLLVAVIVALSGWVGMMIWSASPMCGDMLNLNLVASIIPFVATFVGAWIYKD